MCCIKLEEKEQTPLFANSCRLDHAPEYLEDETSGNLCSLVAQKLHETLVFVVYQIRSLRF